MLTLIYTGREGGEEGDGQGARGPHQGPLQEPAGAEDQAQDEICGAARGVGFNSYMRKADVQQHLPRYNELAEEARERSDSESSSDEEDDDNCCIM